MDSFWPLNTWKYISLFVSYQQKLVRVNGLVDDIEATLISQAYTEEDFPIDSITGLQYYFIGSAPDN